MLIRSNDLVANVCLFSGSSWQHNNKRNASTGNCGPPWMLNAGDVRMVCQVRRPLELSDLYGIQPARARVRTVATFFYLRSSRAHFSKVRRLFFTSQHASSTREVFFFGRWKASFTREVFFLQTAILLACEKNFRHNIGNSSSFLNHSFCDLLLPGPKKLLQKHYFAILPRLIWNVILPGISRVEHLLQWRYVVL